ncbi:MAG: type IV secretory system conjugative DNA transfer family protein [Nesterenkonia sp.]
MSPARSQDRRDISPVLIPFGVILGAVALWFGLPGVLLMWLGLVIAGLMHPAPPKPKAAEKDEPWVQEQQLKHQFFSTMAYTLIAPNKGWFPGWPPLYSFFAAFAVAAAAWHFPQFHHEPVAEAISEWAGPVAEVADWFPVINAVAALLVCLAIAWARRKTLDAEEVCPGTRISDALTVAKKKPHMIIGPGVLGVIVGILAAPILAENSDVSPVWITLAAIVIGAMAGAYPAARHEALTHWREVLEQRREWRERFKAIKKEPAPRVHDLEHLGKDESRITVLHLISNAGVGGSDWFLKNPDKLTATVGGSTTVAVTPVEQTDSKNQPKPGTVDAIKFDIIELPSSEAVPSLGDAKTDEKTTEQLLRAVFAQASAANAERFMPTGHEVITESDARVVKVSVSGIDVKTASKMLPQFSAVIGADVVADPAADNKAGVLYMGNFEGAQFTEESGVTEDTIQYLLKEDWWNQRWADAIKKAENPPKPEWRTEARANLADGTEVNNLVFVIRRGMTPEKDFFPFEPEISTALEAYPFVSMTGFDDPRATRPGERHRQAISLRWADRPVPDSIENLAPVRGSQATHWVLAAILNRGFADAKLARPELVSAAPISAGSSSKHLWQMHVRLYGGTTLAEVRKKRHQLMESWGVDYLRVAETRDGVNIIAGADPQTVDIRDRSAQEMLDALEWEQIFVDSGIKSESGTMPQLISTAPVEENPKVKILTFSLRNTGLALEAFTTRVSKLKANSSNAFVHPQAAASGKPNEVELVVCEEDPMPFPAPMSYEDADGREDLPFAVDVYGRIVAYSPKQSPHLLVSGTSNGGKSAGLMVMLYSALLRGWEVYIADPSKGGTDFFFSRDYIAGITGDLYEAAGMMRHVYEEVTRRKNLNAEYGVSKVGDLPDEVRPNRLLMILDEFTSLMLQEKPPEKSENPEADAAREEVVKANAEKQTIGFLAGKIAREARSAEVTLILATQKLDSTVLNSIQGSADLKSNMGRALFGAATLPEKQVALRNPYNAPDLGESIPPGRGLWEPVTAGRAEAMQAWYDPGEQTAYGAALAQRLDPWPEDQRPDWKSHVRDVDDSPTVRKLDDEDAPVVEQDLGEMDFEFDFDEEEA